MHTHMISLSLSLTRTQAHHDYCYTDHIITVLYIKILVKVKSDEWLSNKREYGLDFFHPLADFVYR